VTVQSRFGNFLLADSFLLLSWANVYSASTRTNGRTVVLAVLALLSSMLGAAFAILVACETGGTIRCVLMRARRGAMPELPAGTVTFLFTDLEGSTRLWEQHQKAMQLALARHDEILGDAVKSAGGLVIKTAGDGLYAVFETAEAGLRADP
jgi:hypothetical protein